MADAPTTTDRMLRPREIAERLGVRVHNVLAWINSGELPASDVSLHQGGKPRWRISEDDLDRFLRRRQKHVAPTPTRRRRPKPQPTDWV